MLAEMYYGGEKLDPADLDHIPFSDLYNSNLLEFFRDEPADEFVSATNEAAFKNSLTAPLEGATEDYLASAEAYFENDEARSRMVSIVKEELPVLLKFADKQIDWPEIYQSLNFKGLPALPESQYLRLFLRDKLMSLLGIDAELFKDSFYYYDALSRRGAPVRRADIVTVYKQAKEVEDHEASMRKVKRVFDDLVLERRKQL